MAIIPNKLQKQKVNHRCKGTHQFRRFTLKNKTFLTDRYYCANCGFTVLLEQIYGWASICWKCGKEFNIRKLKVFPTCLTCSNDKQHEIKHFPYESQEWMESQEPKAEEINKDDVIAEIFRKAGIQ